jgi:hypothetical protein
MAPFDIETDEIIDLRNDPVRSDELKAIQERIGLAIGPDRVIEVRLILGMLLEAVESRDVTHDTAADALRLALAALEGRP